MINHTDSAICIWKKLKYFFLFHNGCHGYHYNTCPCITLHVVIPNLILFSPGWEVTSEPEVFLHQNFNKHIFSTYSMCTSAQLKLLIISMELCKALATIISQETKHKRQKITNKKKSEIRYYTLDVQECGNLVLWDILPSPYPPRHAACWGTWHSLFMLWYYQHSMDQAVVAASWESRCCREDLCWPHSRPGISVLWACNDHPRALLDEVCIMGRFLPLKDESMWHEEENFHPISPPDYPTTYSSLIACCVS